MPFFPAQLAPSICHHMVDMCARIGCVCVYSSPKDKDSRYFYADFSISAAVGGKESAAQVKADSVI